MHFFFVFAGEFPNLSLSENASLENPPKSLNDVLMVGLSNGILLAFLGIFPRYFGDLATRSSPEIWGNT